MTTAFDRNATLATVPTTAVDRRAAGAVNVTARHLTNRPAKHIMARQVGDMWVWRVDSQTGDEQYVVTLQECGAPYTTCSCPDFQYRGVNCKHLRAVRLIAGVPEPLAPAKPKRVYAEREEEI